MTKKEWKERYYFLEDKYNSLNSKHNKLKIIHKTTLQDLTQSILDSAKIQEKIEQEESDKIIKLITKYSKLKQDFTDEVSSHDSTRKELLNQINTLQSLYDDLVSNL